MNAVGDGSSGTYELTAWNGSTLTQLALISDHTWYELKIDADYDAQTYDVSYRVHGASMWTMVADDFVFVPAGSGHGGLGGGTAFQKLYCATASCGMRFDNLKVVPGPVSELTFEELPAQNQLQITCGDFQATFGDAAYGVDQGGLPCS